MIYRRNIKHIITIFVFIAACLLIYNVVMISCFSWQVMENGELCYVTTPEPQKYKNDVLHPSIKCIDDSTYIMIQSPYYLQDNKIENPIYYKSNFNNKFENGVILRQTPSHGYNSDPNIFYDNGKVYVLWRECNTSLTDSLGVIRATVGGELDSVKLGKIKLYVSERQKEQDREQCPIIINYNGYLIYASWYSYTPKRKYKGIAIWEGTSIENPDFLLVDTVRLTTFDYEDVTVYKRMFPYKEKKIHDFWHMDFFEYNGRLYMISVQEAGLAIFLSVSEDGKHFKHFKKPLLHHYAVSPHKIRYFYKPTAFVQNDSLFLYYTLSTDYKETKLYLTKESMPALLNKLAE